MTRETNLNGNEMCESDDVEKYPPVTLPFERAYMSSHSLVRHTHKSYKHAMRRHRFISMK